MGNLVPFNGSLSYELCTLKHAFDATNLLGLVFKIVSENYPPIPERYDVEVHDLVNRLLAKVRHRYLVTFGIIWFRMFALEVMLNHAESCP